MKAEAGATIRSMVYVIRGIEQLLLGLEDAKRLGIIRMNMRGASQQVDTVARLERVVKQPAVKTGVVLGGQTPEIINRELYFYYILVLCF